jgi:hypothetical protein
MQVAEQGLEVAIQELPLPSDEEFKSWVEAQLKGHMRKLQEMAEEERKSTAQFQALLAAQKAQYQERLASYNRNLASFREDLATFDKGMASLRQDVARLKVDLSYVVENVVYPTLLNDMYLQAEDLLRHAAAQQPIAHTVADNASKWEHFEAALADPMVQQAGITRDHLQYAFPGVLSDTDYAGTRYRPDMGRTAQAVMLEQDPSKRACHEAMFRLVLNLESAEEVCSR